MLNYKGFSIPRDISILIRTVYSIMKWTGKVRRHGFNNLVLRLGSTTETSPASDSDLVFLKKLHRMLYFFLERILRHKNPCTIASLSIFDVCERKKIKCTLVVGVKKDGKNITGHSWIEVNGTAVNEDKALLDKFTRMKEV